MNKGKDQKEFDDVSLLDEPREKNGSAVALSAGLDTVALFANKVLMEVDGRLAQTMIEIMNECFDECEIPLYCQGDYSVVTKEGKGD